MLTDTEENHITNEINEKQKTKKNENGTSNFDQEEKNNFQEAKQFQQLKTKSKKKKKKK